jgi:Leucine-rich repeat (LRR) protein
MCIRKNEGNGINNFGKKRSEIFKLRISEQKLEGILNLSDFVQLEELYCRNNQLIQIILPSNNKLKILGCSNNLLTTFDYDKLNPHTLTEL